MTDGRSPVGPALDLETPLVRALRRIAKGARLSSLDVPILDDAVDEIDALTSENTRLRAEIGRGAAPPPQAWQSIDTAPKDGTWVLLARRQVLSGELIVVSGSWNSGGSMHMPHWMTPVLGFKPTHWMALPAPPEGERT
jgi:hypothetical protein